MSIYSSTSLQNSIYKLEKKYNLIDHSNKFANLVNFSKNYDVPFHKWFRYREGFAGELIEELLKDSGINKDEVVIDPFSGSGTTLVVSVLNGYKTLGIDVNPLSSFITNVKLKSYTQEELTEFKNSIVFMNKKKLENTTKYKDVEKYFTEENFLDLCTIREYIEDIQEGKLKDLLLTAFISIIEASSNRKRDGNGLKTVVSKVTNVFEYFEQKCLEIIRDIEGVNYTKNYGIGLCVPDTAANLHSIFLDNESFLGNSKVGTIIFSPPYPNSFDYFESYKLELVFGGFSSNISDIKQFREKAVRSFVGVKAQLESDILIDLLATEIELAIPNKELRTGKKDFRTRKVPNMIKGYFSDMKEIIKQCGLALEKGRKVYIVVDQSAYVGIIIPTDILLAYLAEDVGFEVGRIIECRKARTSAQQLKDFPYLNNVLRESIVELVKK